MHLRRARLGGLFWVHHRGQNVDFHLDEIHGVLRRVGAIRDHHGHRLSDETHRADRQGMVNGHFHPRASGTARNGTHLAEQIVPRSAPSPHQGAFWPPQH